MHVTPPSSELSRLKESTHVLIDFCIDSLILLGAAISGAFLFAAHRRLNLILICFVAVLMNVFNFTKCLSR